MECGEVYVTNHGTRLMPTLSASSSHMPKLVIQTQGNRVPLIDYPLPLQSPWHITTHTLVTEMVPYCTQMFPVLDMKATLLCAPRTTISPSPVPVGKQLEFFVEIVSYSTILQPAATMYNYVF